MDLHLIYSKTVKGLKTANAWFSGLSSQAKQVLTLVDGRLSAADILAQSDKLTEDKLEQVLAKLESEGYIRQVVSHSAADDWSGNSNSYGISVEVLHDEDDSDAETLDFTNYTPESQTDTKADEAAIAQAQAEEEARQQAEAERQSKAAAAEKAKLEAERIAREKAKAEEAARVKAEAAARAKAEAQEKARIEAERVAREAAERKAKEVAAAKAKAEEEARQKAEAEHKAKAAAEEQAKLKAEREKAIAEEAARLKAEEEARARVEAERKAKFEAEEQARLEAARIEREKAEAEEVAARAKAEAEEKARIEAERLARETAEREAREAAEAKAKAEEEAQRQAEAERKAQLEAERAEREKAEAEEVARLTEEAEARTKAEAEEKARIETERIAREESERKAREAAEAQAAAEEEVRRQAEAERKAIAEAEEQARLEAERIEREKAEAEERARLEAERIAREEAERQLKEEAEARAQAEAEARQAAERKAHEEAEIRARAEAEERARIEVERQAQKEAERIAREEEKAKHEAEKQAQRAAEQAAREEAKRIARAEKEEKARLKAEERAREKALRGPAVSGKWMFRAGMTLLVLIPLTIALLVGVLQFINLGMLVQPVEKLASDSIGEPVTVREVHASLFPQPHLVLGGVTVGSNAVIMVDAVYISPVTSTLFEKTKTLKFLELESLTLAPADFGRAVQWVNAAAGSGKLKIERIEFKRVAFRIPGLVLTPFDGQVGLTSSGQFNHVELSSADKGLTIKLTPQNGSCGVELMASGWQPPLGGHLAFEELTAKGMIGQNQVVFSQVEGQVYGGTFKAHGTVSWVSGLSASGSFELSKANLARALSDFGSSASVDGSLNATATFASKADEASKLADAPEIRASFNVLDGKIGGIDLVHLLLSGGSQSQARDTTRFDRLSGSMQFGDGHYKYSQISLQSAQVRASGNFDIQPNHAISGRLGAELTAKSRHLQASFGLGGTVENVKIQ